MLSSQLTVRHHKGISSPTACIAVLTALQSISASTEKQTDRPAGKQRSHAAPNSTFRVCR